MDNSVSTASNQDTSKKTVQSNRTAPGAGHKDTYLQGALLNSKATSQIRKDANFGRTARAMKLAKKSGKISQDQPQFLHWNNKCLHCASDHQSSGCPTRQQHQANTTSNPASSPGIYQNTCQFSNTSHTSQQSQSTVGITTPTLPVTNPPFQHNFQHPPPINQQLNYQV